MNSRLIFGIAKSLLLARWRQTLVAAVGVTFSIAMFITLLGFMNGLNDLLEPVAEALGNTPAVSRKSYVHPALVEAVKEAPRRRLSLHCPRSTKYLSSVERGLIAFLGRRSTRRRKGA